MWITFGEISVGVPDFRASAMVFLMRIVVVGGFLPLPNGRPRLRFAVSITAGLYARLIFLQREIDRWNSGGRVAAYMEAKVSIRNGSEITTETCRPEFSVESTPSGPVFYYYTGAGNQYYAVRDYPLRSQGIRIESDEMVIAWNYPESIK